MTKLSEMVGHGPGGSNKNEVTPVMVRAGVDALWESYDPEAPGFDRELVIKVYCAMQSARGPSVLVRLGKQ
jgi:hypothetical protein